MANRFDTRLERLRPAIWAKVARIEELKGQWIGGTRLSPQILGRLKRSVLVTSTGASTRIEGARLSDGDVEKLIRGIAIQRFADRDKQEVRGYFELLQNVFDAYEDIRFSESSIKHLHKELLKFVAKDKRHLGEYKKTENAVQMVDASGRAVGTIFETTPAYLTPKEMQELSEWTAAALRERKFHSLLVIGNFLVEFLNIHPFQDGNGRLSRILTNLLMLKAGYLYMPYVSHEKLIEDRKTDYYLALRKSQRTFKKDASEDVAPWLDYFLDIVYAQSRMAVDLLSQEGIEQVLSSKQLAVWEYLQQVDEATAGAIAKMTKVARPTVNQALKKILRMGRIQRLGLGRGTRYRKSK
jgi:Fic family protein